MNRTIAALATAAAFGFAGLANAQGQGVTAKEIVLGTAQDLSGPVAPQPMVQGAAPVPGSG